MREILKLGGKLLLIAVVAGLALGVTNEVTQGPIAEQALLSADTARREVLFAADTFEEVEEGIYRGTDAAGQTVGFVTTVAENGYGGEIEVTVGIGMDGVITGVSVGGEDFSETAGLGARVKEEAFRAQFAGLTAPVALTKDGGQVDAVTSATISSTAVKNAVNRACELLTPYAERG